MTIASFTSTGSKHPDVLYGGDADGAPIRMVSSHGAHLVGDDGRTYLDFVMGLGAVTLGYAHEAVVEAALDAVRRGGVGALAPVDEAALADEIGAVMPSMQEVRFLKSGAEAAAAAVRLARAATGRDRVLGCGYHGWLDWCSEGAGVPRATRDLYGTIAFNDVEASVERIRACAAELACVVIEPVILEAPDPHWIDAVSAETKRAGALLIVDEIKTGFRVAPGGATERWSIAADLAVLGKALANGFPLAAVGGAGAVMAHVRNTWISSTLATEFVSLAAARAAIRVCVDKEVPRHLALMGGRLWNGLGALCDRFPEAGIVRRGIPEMCHLEFADAGRSHRITVACARAGVLWKRSAYNFVSLAHDERAVDTALSVLESSLAADLSGDPAC